MPRRPVSVRASLSCSYAQPRAPRRRSQRCGRPADGPSSTARTAPECRPARSSGSASQPARPQAALDALDPGRRLRCGGGRGRCPRWARERGARRFEQIGPWASTRSTGARPAGVDEAPLRLPATPRCRGGRGGRAFGPERPRRSGESSLSAELGRRHATAIVVGRRPATSRPRAFHSPPGRFLADLDLRERKRVACSARASPPAHSGGGSAREPVRLGGDWYTVVASWRTGPPLAPARCPFGRAGREPGRVRAAARPRSRTGHRRRGNRPSWSSASRMSHR